jgi:hypothetical protein
VEPILISIVSALVAGATAKAKDVASKAVSDAHDGLKSLLIRKLSKSGAVQSVAFPVRPAGCGGELLAPAFLLRVHSRKDHQMATFVEAGAELRPLGILARKRTTANLASANSHDPSGYYLLSGRLFRPSRYTRAGRQKTIQSP